MPEIAEVARIVHFLKKHAVGRVIQAVKAQEDTIVYGKVGTSASEFEEEMTGKKIVDAKRQGKYFWLEMDSAPHPLMHFGMSGWMKFSNDDTAYYRSEKPKDTEWPPKSWKFILELEGEPECKIAFVDTRRLGRVRLINAKAEDMRKTSPLKENGPDPVLDPDILTVDWLGNKLRSKRVPVKALLLDQANISGIGNWVGDEIMYQARLHPEQYSNTFSDAQVKQLHEAMMRVCNTAVDKLGYSDDFPEDWLMTYRWDKGKKNGGKLPNGAKITFLTVGGRTSAVVPSVQKKTGAVAGDVSESTDAADDSEQAEPKPKKRGKGKSNIKEEDEAKEPKKEEATKRAKRGRAQVEEEAAEDDEVKPQASKKQKAAINATPRKGKKAETKSEKTEEVDGRRRSRRLSKG